MDFSRFRNCLLAFDKAGGVLGTRQSFCCSIESLQVKGPLELEKIMILIDN